MRVYWILAVSAIRKNTSYVWAHMANNVGSALFGLIYMSLWRAAVHGKPLGTFTAQTLVGYIAVGQLMLWLSTFIPPGLGVAGHIRTGQIALEFSRPIGYFSRVFFTGAGEVLYNALFRACPLAIVFALLQVLPLHFLASPQRVLLLVIAISLSATIGLLMQYLIGITAFWTVEIRWARRLFFVLSMFCGGQLLPLQLMPHSLQTAFVWLPFQSLISFPTSVWLQRANPEAWISTVLWGVTLVLLCRGLTRRASRSLEVNGG